MNKKESGIKMLIVLTGVCLLSAAVLGYIHISTFERIEKNRIKRIEEAVSNVLPGITDYEKVSSDPVIFKGKNGDADAGYAVLSSGMGFQGDIVLMVGLDSTINNIEGVVILESVETPGLGDKIRELDFLKQFQGKNVSSDSEIGVDAITGATISSVAVGKIINKAVEYAKRIF
ncbi:MAG: FMN-binding protein [bacterium]|nr:FMN-binding protein [bacterium]